MLEAIKIAKKGRGRTKTNPLVGCVLTKNDEIIAKGYHSSYGQKHAGRPASINVAFTSYSICKFVFSMIPTSLPIKSDSAIEKSWKTVPKIVKHQKRMKTRQRSLNPKLISYL